MPQPLSPVNNILKLQQNKLKYCITKGHPKKHRKKVYKSGASEYVCVCDPICVMPTHNVPFSEFSIKNVAREWALSVNTIIWKHFVFFCVYVAFHLFLSKSYRYFQKKTAKMERGSINLLRTYEIMAKISWHELKITISVLLLIRIN